MTAAHQIIRWITAVRWSGSQGRGFVSCEHASALVRAHGESGWTARLIPLTVGGLIYASSMAMLDSRDEASGCLRPARWLLGLGIATTLEANVAHGPGARRARRDDGRVADGGPSSVLTSC